MANISVTLDSADWVLLLDKLDISIAQDQDDVKLINSRNRLRTAYNNAGGSGVDTGPLT